MLQRPRRQSNSIKLKILLAFALTFIALLTSIDGLQAQDTLSREAWIDKVFDLVYASASLTPDETQWVKNFMDKGCDCNAIKEEVLGKECGIELLKEEGMPTDEAAFEKMTPGQMKKFNLIGPLLSAVGGKCPDK